MTRSLKERIKALFLFAALAVCIVILPQTAFAVEQTTIEASNSSEFDDAVSIVNAATSGEYSIKLTGDIEIGDASFNGACPTTILGNGHTIILGQYGSLHVQSGSQLSLGAQNGSDTLKISGGDKQSNDVPGLLNIAGFCNMYPGVTIADRKGDNYFGGGVTVNGGKFHMYGGAIENCGITSGSMCYGGGVAVVYGGSFIMDGGVITNCFATSSFKAAEYGMDSRIVTSSGGGVFVSGGSTFIMNDGEISRNRASEMGGGIAVVASIDEISNGGFGNLESSAQILGGTVFGNEANDGAGIFASAYYYAAAWGICADVPNVGAAENPGLFVKNAQISNNNANQDEGYGGGMLIVMLKSPAKAEIDNSLIKSNSAAVGGGVMSYGYYTNLTINSCIITENNAVNYGGGFGAESNTGQDAGTAITNTKLHNNNASKAASDIYLNESPLKLSQSQNTNFQYLGKPDDVTGMNIDGWYTDDEDLRFADQSKDQRSGITGNLEISSNGKACLIAAANPSLVKISFTSDDGNRLYSESWYPVGTKAELIQVPTPTKPSDDMYDYVFDSWTPNIADAIEDVVYKAQFKKIPKGNRIDPDNGDNDGQKPGNGDNEDGQKPEPGAGNSGCNQPDNDDKDLGADNNGDGQSNENNENHNINAAGNGNATYAENATPATGDTADSLASASVLITCCALAIAIIAQRKRINL